jgi:hypothetical protein
MPNHVLVMTQSINVNIACYVFHVWAGDFLAAATLYAPTARPGSLVAHFLCCQSIELSLKAFLSLKGQSRPELKRDFGHNLIELYTEASSRGLGTLVTLGPEDLTTVMKANDWYDTTGGKKFQYCDIGELGRGLKGAPNLVALESLATRLQATALRDAVRG